MPWQRKVSIAWYKKGLCRGRGNRSKRETCLGIPIETVRISHQSDQEPGKVRDPGKTQLIRPDVSRETNRERKMEAGLSSEGALKEFSEQIH